MRTIIYSSIFLLILIASTARAQTPTITATIPPTNTIPSTPTVTATPIVCPEPTVENFHGNIWWEPYGVSPGEEITFTVTYLGYDCEVLEAWQVNYEIITAEPREYADMLVITMPPTCQLDVRTIFGTRLGCEPFPGDLVEPIPQPTTTLIPQPPEPTSIPESLTLILFGTGMAGLAGYAAARRR